jgi:hypothetical protein
MMKLRRTRIYLSIIALIGMAVLAGCPGTGTDATAPTVSSTSPADSAGDIALDANITATFSEDMDGATVTAANFTLASGSVPVAGAVSYADKVATFNPSSELDYGAVYTATLKVGMADLAGNALAAEKSWSFSTGAMPDTTRPTVVSVSPLASATGVALAANLSATFSEALDPATVTASSFTLVSGSGAVTGAVGYSGTVATFDPAAELAYGTLYTAQITTGVKDAAGNSLATAKVWAFTTIAEPDTVPPTVSSTNPADLEANVSINDNLTAYFSEAMGVSTITAANFTLFAGAAEVTGTVVYDVPNKAAVFAPAANLSPGTAYTATIKTGAKDAAGNALAADKVWTFTTNAAGSGPAPVVLGTAGNFTILAKTAITNIPNTVITGDIGLSPAAESYLTGFSQTKATGYSTSPQVIGFIYAADMTPPTPTNMTIAIADMETAYTDAAGRPTPDHTDLSGGTIGGLTLYPGLYTWGTDVLVTTDITISGGANDVWIFQMSGNLLTSSATNVILSGGAQAKNIFWQVAGQATLGTNSHMEGTILSQTAVTMATGSSLHGRALAQSQVALDQVAATHPNY